MHSRIVGPMRTIVAVANDIGGAQAIHPVIAKLRKKANLQVNVVAGGFAQKVFARLRSENAEADWSEAEIDDYLDKTRPDLVLSATSWKSLLEQRFRNRVRLRNIPSVVVIDFWSNYRLRWHDAAYQFEDSRDWVCVPDSNVAEAMVADGYPKAFIRVTGQPHLEWCYRTGSQRPRLLEDKRGITVLFLTISLAALGLKEDAAASVQVVCQALKQWHATTRKPVFLTVRPHPHEALATDFVDRIQAFSSQGVQVRLADRTKPIFVQLKKSDLVLGFITMGLFGKEAIAIKLADHPPELIAAMEDAGIPFVPFDAQHIGSAFCRPRSAHSKQPANTHLGAATAIASLCGELIAKSPAKA
jgi:hypothetical protein